MVSGNRIRQVKSTELEWEFNLYYTDLLFLDTAIEILLSARKAAKVCWVYYEL